MTNTLVQLPSGTIDLVINEQKNVSEMLLQFNCECKDALPYCGAMCCRLQQVYSAEMTDKEARKFGSRILETQDKDILLMPLKVNKQNECKHLGENKLCTVHQTKPETCRKWHCSPKGKGDGIVIFAKGWTLLPNQT